MRKYAAASIVFVIVALGLLVFVNPENNKAVEIIGEPTNFVRQGVVVLNNPGMAEGIPYLVYEEPGSPALTKELYFDELSFCVVEGGSQPCEVFDEPLSQTYQGKEAVVEGIEQADGRVLVRKMRGLREGEMFLMYDPGRIFISWEQARQLIQNCDVKMVMQTHSLDVRLTLRDDREVVTVSPAIDDVFELVQQAGCEDVSIATE